MSFFRDDFRGNMIIAKRRSIQSIIAVMLLMAICFSLAGCMTARKWRYNPITDVNNLEGRKVGVNLAWESDYYLTGRTDMELYRYDTTADMIMALKYDKLDALAVDEDTARLILTRSKGLEVVQPAYAVSSSIMYFGSNDEALAQDFNRYLAEYKKTDEYKDMLKRLAEFDGSEYDDPGIAQTGSGKVIRVAADPNNYPRTFQEPGEEVFKGFDLEILMHYAYERNYRLEIFKSNYDDGVIGLQSGLYDVMTGFLGDIYARQIREIGLYPGDGMFTYPMYYIQKNQRDINVATEDIG